MPRTALFIAEPSDNEEIDMGDLRSAMTEILSTTSSVFASPVGMSATPRTAVLPELQIPPLLSRKSSLGHLNSPSSPELVKVPRPPGLSRSRTLPRVPQVDVKSRRKNSGIDGLVVEQSVATKIRRWIFGIAIVDFDVDDGPVVNGVYPSFFMFSSESENIAFSAFPDSSQSDQGSQNHSFRIREHEISMPNDKRPSSMDGFMYGFSYFTQRKDPLSKRGYEQRSVVILTQHPYPALFSCVASIFGPLFQAHGAPMLEVACHNIATWSDPTPGTTVELGFLGSVLNVELPHTSEQQQMSGTASFQEKYDPKLHILASSPTFSPPPLLLFEACLSNLWSIWECLVLGEPILVFGSSPGETSQAIWWFRDLLRPIPLAGDFRPYFTIHDQDHSSLVNKLPPKAGLLLGVTNPFFERSCAHWPHILSLGRRALPISSAKGSPTLRPPGPAPGWKTKTHKRYISKDRPLLKQLEDACRASEPEKLNASLLLRRHFCTRTTELLIPLARYLNTLIPTPSEVDSARARNVALRLKPFSSANFFTSLKAHGSTLPFRSTSKRTEFYDRWLKTPAFGLWLAQQEQIVQEVLRESVERLTPS